jgi:hypothetical protein
MKNAEKVVRGSNWRGPGLVKAMDSWRKWEEPADEGTANVISLEKETLRAANNTTKWNMPDQPDGYIKCKKHDFL